MKKSFSLACVVILSVCLLSSCGGTQQKTDNTSEKDKTYGWKIESSDTSSSPQTINNNIDYTRLSDEQREKLLPKGPLTLSSDKLNKTATRLPAFAANEKYIGLSSDYIFTETDIQNKDGEFVFYKYTAYDINTFKPVRASKQFNSTKTNNLVSCKGNKLYFYANDFADKSKVNLYSFDVKTGQYSVLFSQKINDNEYSYTSFTHYFLDDNELIMDIDHTECFEESVLKISSEIIRVNLKTKKQTVITKPEFDKTNQTGEYIQQLFAKDGLIYLYKRTAKGDSSAAYVGGYAISDNSSTETVPADIKTEFEDSIIVMKPDGNVKYTMPCKFVTDLYPFTLYSKDHLNVLSFNVFGDYILLKTSQSFGILLKNNEASLKMIYQQYTGKLDIVSDISGTYGNKAFFCNSTDNKFYIFNTENEKLSEITLSNNFIESPKLQGNAAAGDFTYELYDCFSNKNGDLIFSVSVHSKKDSDFENRYFIIRGLQ